MTSQDLRATLDSLGLSQVGACRLLGVEPSTMYRWAHGRREVPEPVARFLRLLLAAPITPEEAARALGVAL